MRNTVIAFFVILAAIVVTKDDGPRETSSFLPQRTAAVRCTVTPQRVTERDNTMIAAGQFRCDAPGPDGLTVTVHLQRNDGGQWTTIIGQSFVSNSVYTTRERSAADRTREISVKCASGTYRTWIEASVYDNGATRRLSEVSGERRNPCG